VIEGKLIPELGTSREFMILAISSDQIENCVVCPLNTSRGWTE